MYKALTIAFTLLASNALAEPSTSQLRWLTEELYPYNYSHNGQLTGLSYEIIQASLEGDIQNFHQKVEVLPWSRAFSITQTEKDTALFSTARTENREKLFYWVGPIADARRVAIYKKSSNVNITTANDLKNYNSSVVLQDSGDFLLKAHRIPDEKIQKTQSLEHSLRLLKSNLVDVMVYNEAAARVKMKDLGMDPREYNFAFTLSTDQMYIAISKTTNNETVKRIQSKIKSFKETQAYQDLLVKYNFK